MNIEIKDMGSYYEMSLMDAIIWVPEIVRVLPPELNVADRNYIARIQKEPMAFEFGYPSDNWHIK